MVTRSCADEPAEAIARDPGDGPTAADLAWWAAESNGPADGWTDADETAEERLRAALTRSALDVFLDEVPPEEWDRLRRDHCDGLGDPLW
jgi:hypothetical protein